MTEQKNAPKPTFQVWIPLYLQALENRNCSKKTQKSYQITLTSFARYKKYLAKNQGDAAGYRNYLDARYKTTRVLDTNVALETTRDEVESYFAALKATNGTKPSTIHLYMRILNGFFSFLYYRGVVAGNPLGDMQPPKVKGREIKCLPHDDVLELIEKIKNPRDALIVRTIYATGVRVSELCGMMIEDVDFRSQNIRVEGKGGKIRRVFCDEKTLELMEKYLAGRIRGPVFLGKTGNKLTPQRIEEIFRKNAPRGITPHTIRHSHATEMYHHSHDLTLVQKILGHESIRTTEIYLHNNHEAERLAYMTYFPLNTPETNRPDTGDKTERV